MARGGLGVRKTPLRNRPLVRCTQCDKEFRRVGNNALAPKFCSRDCRFQSMRKPGGPGIDAVCDGCGTAFRRTAAALARVKKSFCTEACMRLHRPRARRDRTKAWRGVQWRQISDLIRCLDNYTCQWCGQPETGTEELSVDHIVPFHSFDDAEQANSYDNLVALHRDCHNRKTTGPERKWKMGNTKELEEWMRRVKANRDSTRFGIQREGAA